MEDLINKKFNRLLVIRKVADKKTLLECLCDCGKTVYTYPKDLISGNVKSCGCYRLDRIKKLQSKHNMAHTRLYGIWKGLRQRCDFSWGKSYDRYGGRGIKVCDEWDNDFTAFYDWAISNGYDENAPFGQCTIDRIDTNKDYCPENCRWVTLKEQANNRTNTLFYTYNNETHSLADWARIINIDYQTLYTRIHKKHWDIERALTTPSKGNPWEAHRKKLLNQPH